MLMSRFYYYILFCFVIIFIFTIEDYQTSCLTKIATFDGDLLVKLYCLFEDKFMTTLVNLHCSWLKVTETMESKAMDKGGTTVLPFKDEKNKAPRLIK